ncbi:MAG TPA: biopolymer transporter ExbD [Longimicrobium sp.]|nr:biopolymer transporter ExbD [Longimicrobium sp.]
MAIPTKPPHLHGLTSEINVTPMVDVMLVLLIIFMVVTTTLPYTAQLPAARKALPAREDRVTLGIDVHGQYWIDGVPEPGPIAAHALAGRLAAAYADRGMTGDNLLYLKADHGVSYALVMRAMDSARQVGVRRVAMITEEAPD